MKTLVYFIAALLAFFACTTTVSNNISGNEETSGMQSDEEIASIVIARETESLTNWANGNPKGYAVNFDETGTYVDNIMAQDMLVGLNAVNAYLAKLDSMKLIGKHSFKLVNPRVQVAGDAAILTLQYHSLSEDGSPGDPWKATVVYARSDEDWKVIHANWSPLNCQ